MRVIDVDLNHLDPQAALVLARRVADREFAALLERLRLVDEGCLTAREIDATMDYVRGTLDRQQRAMLDELGRWLAERLH